jgi:spermidine/putrescine transport system substrate-binding protein
MKKFKNIRLSTALLLFLPTPVFAQKTEEIYLLIWSNFLDQELFSQFTKETGIKIIAEGIDSNKNVMAKLQVGKAYDIASASSYYVEPILASHLAQTIDFSQELPNWKNVSAFARDPDYDTHHNTVPNSFGTVGIIVNRALSKDPIKNWSDLFKPAEAMKGKIGMVDDPNAVFTAAYHVQGQDLCDAKPETYKDLEALLLAQKPFVRSYAMAGASERLAAGDVSIQMGWYTFVHQNLKTNSSLEYIVPEGPAYSWIETFFIPTTAKNPAAARKFLDFMLRPENSAHFNNFIGYIPPVDGAENLLSDDLKKSPELATAKTRTLVFQKACPIDVINAQSRIWAKLMAQ